MDPVLLVLCSKSIPAAYGNIGNKHGAGVPIEEGTEAGKDRFNHFYWDDRKDHDLAAGIIEHEMPFMKSMVALPGNVADDRVSGRFHFV